ncbi:MAG: 5-formyltetrahydrofolate cyclo-ligase [Tetragenococcus halophilus]|uniref:5-formyltetrahydrofolate cyclo-ligase n=1 Tax=Tetragenococcus halophilus TaxID=51669 RepID=UPI001F15866C|nr:5-formyltetrahydrofolate cyclo-ligase [Tetragenococcus halophilus]MCF1601896.1 5-formyltetrahydrofolate cyclo-ligase [Tetragenococcus halophilus]MCF1675378.1 5-formyltetrahydrofolate cyclo-ligase [Tetragenococcus halophilus]MCO8286502.1 5-formyltetrahydrofolate cyclo-ligase [Tetragenococcus halophilus]MCO8289247.1 5-formyltetrahydrofolate cyclo-ligase [Tetragenococcus halophilus]MCO8291597.1 5-formyltetrahydrofolate cyclo-ligase [Tetragenococcus halophilus]
MDKSILRQEGKKQLEELAKHIDKKRKKEQQITTLLFHSKLWKEAQTIGMVRSQSFELNTEPIMKKALSQGKKVVVPKTLPERQLNFYEVDENTTYQLSDFGIEEPMNSLVIAKKDIDLILVPGLIFSKKGYRIGFGKGYYDRFLEDFSGKTCGLAFSEQLNDDWQAEEFDQAVTRIYTDTLEGSYVYE